MSGCHKWVKSFENITEEKYDIYFDYFNLDLYDAKEWARMAKEAGMKYAIFTTKHYEGFCMYDSKFKDYKCTNTKAKRDLFGEFVDTFRNEGIRIGIYYLLMDWHHPDFTIDCFHLLHDGSELKFEEKQHLQGNKEKFVEITLPVVKPNVTVPVIEVMLK